MEERLAPLRIVIVGGGTAGWMAANLFAAAWPRERVRITLVESPEIGIIGVGEGSTPLLRKFFADLGIDERDWMPRCNATYKLNIMMQQVKANPRQNLWFVFKMNWLISYVSTRRERLTQLRVWDAA